MDNSPIIVPKDIWKIIIGKAYQNKNKNKWLKTSEGIVNLDNVMGIKKNRSGFVNRNIDIILEYGAKTWTVVRRDTPEWTQAQNYLQINFDTLHPF